MARPPTVGKAQKPSTGGRTPEDYLARLKASLPGTVADEPTRDQITYLPRYQLTPNRDQPRRQFDVESLEDLAESIRAAGGIIQPLIVKKVAAQRYEIIAGERRWRAAGIIDMDEIPCIVRDDLTEAKELMFALIENIQRNDLNPIEEAAGLRRLIDEFGLSHRDAANAVGRSRSAVTNLMRLLDLAESVQQALADRRIEMGHARALGGVDTDAQAQLLGQLLEHQWSVRQTEAAVREWKTKQQGRGGESTPAPPYPADRLASLEARLQKALGYAVKIRCTATGKVTVTLETLEDWEKILEQKDD